MKSILNEYESYMFVCGYLSNFIYLKPEFTG